MAKKWFYPMAVTVLVVCGPTLQAQPDLQRKLKDTGLGAHWIYDDIPQAFARAKATGKPILALFR